MYKINIKISHLIISIFLLLSLPAQAQQGDYYLYNYKVPILNIDNHNLSAVQGKNDILYFANTKGIITYDGISWEIINTPGTPYSLAYDATNNGNLYVGCSENFGYLTIDEAGKESYISISEKTDMKFGEISEIFITQQDVYFYSTKALFHVSLKSLKIEKIWKADKEFTGVVCNNNKIYINLHGKGLHQIAGDKLYLVKGGKIFEDLYINSSLNYNDKTALICTHNNEIYLFDGKIFKQFEFDAQKYIEVNQLLSGIDLSENEFALSTLSGGCVIIDKKTGKTKKIINYQTGLPDDEVLALCKDSQGGLWICNEYGITRAALNLPVHNFSNYYGLEGNVISVISCNNTIYTATSEGLFYLSKVSDYEEVVNFIKKEQIQYITKTTTPTTKTLESITKTIKITESKEIIKKGIIHSIFGKKEYETKIDTTGEITATKEVIDTIETPAIEEIPSIEEIIVESAIPASYSKFASPEARKIYALQSIPFIYKPVEGINGKCRQLINYNGKLIVASNTGLYEVETRLGVSLPIIKDLYINFICQSKQYTNRFYVGVNNGLISIFYKEGKWEIIPNEINSSIYSIIEDKNTLWLGSINQVLKIKLLEDGKFSKSKSYSIKNNYNEIIIVRMVENNPSFFSHTGIYSYDEQKNILYKAPELQKYHNQDSKILYNQPDFTWTNINSRWQNITLPKETGSLKTAFLNLFKDIQDIYIDTEKNIWAISNNELYRIDTNAFIDYKQKYNIYLKRILNNQGSFLPFKNLVLSYNNNSLSFQLASPFFLSESSTQYQYLLEGLSQEWSAWNKQSIISFPFLPGGSYTLYIRAKNVFGQISNKQTLSFKVTPPFWQSWWFYLLCFIVLAGTVFGLIKLRTKSLERANKILDAKVQEKTKEITKQKNLIEEKNEDITKSINYAQKIQSAILPLDEGIRKALPNSFVLLKPRDIVSGDFYWFAEKKDLIIIVAADCTGHGVPGAFMCMIGNTMLNHIINEKNITQPAEILDNLNNEIFKSLKQEHSKSRDGMDIAICTIYKKKNQLAFAGANNPLYIILNNEKSPLKKGGVLAGGSQGDVFPKTTNLHELIEIKGNDFSIGGIQKNRKKFTNHLVTIDDDTSFYIFSDGYIDQFGGEDDRKFMSKRFKELLTSIYHEKFDKQKEILAQTFEEWKGEKPQVDDILVIGFRTG